MAPESQGIYTNGDLLVSVIRIEERLVNLSDDIRELKEAMAGSRDRPGLLERTTLLEQRSISHEGRLESMDRRIVAMRTPEGSGEISKKTMGMIIVGLVGSIGSLIKLLVDAVT